MAMEWCMERRRMAMRKATRWLSWRGFVAGMYTVSLDEHSIPTHGNKSDALGVVEWSFVVQ
jgi:hypothetical protein